MTPPAPPPVASPAPGIWTVPAPLPGSALGYSLLYVVAHPDGAAVVDAGVDSPPTRAALRTALGAAGRSVDDVTHVLLTHHHPDHTGLAEHLRAAAGATIAIGAGDAAPLRDPFGAFLDAFVGELRLAGTPEAVLAAMLEEVHATARATSTRGVEPDVLLRPGERLTLGAGHRQVALDVLGVPGHTAGHVALLDRARGVLLSGDALLPGGLVQLDVLSDGADDPLADLLASLETLARCGAALALPGHGAPFADVPAAALAQRMRQLVRRDAVAAVLADRPHLTAWEVTAALSRRPWEQTSVVARRYAVMETAAVMRALGALPDPPQSRPTSSSAR